LQNDSNKRLMARTFSYFVIFLVSSPLEITCHLSATCKIPSEIFKGALDLFEPYENMMNGFENQVEPLNFTERIARAACTDPFTGLRGAIFDLRFDDHILSTYIRNDGDLKTEFMITGMLRGLERHHTEISEAHLSSSHEVPKRRSLYSYPSRISINLKPAS
jgi:hypothetical protein